VRVEESWLLQQRYKRDRALRHFKSAVAKRLRAFSPKMSRSSTNQLSQQNPYNFSILKPRTEWADRF
jgi:hypothetical protein